MVLWHETSVSLSTISVAKYPYIDEVSTEMPLRTL